MGAQIEVGGLRARPTRLWASNLEDLDSWVGVKSGGFLGYDLLRRWVIDLDLRNGWVRFREPFRESGKR